MRPFVAAGAIALCLVTSHCGEDAADAPSASRVAEVDRAESPNLYLPGGDATQDAPQTLAASSATVGDHGAPVDAATCQQNLAKSAYVACNSTGKLSYPVDRTSKAVLLDYSRVGYHGGDDPLPTLPLRHTLAPSGKDDTAALQAAINAVATRSADAKGFRGRIKLGPGVFKVNRTLLIAKGGIVLEGQGSTGTRTTTVQLTGSATNLFHVRGSGTASVQSTQYPVAKVPVPAGTTQLTLAKADGLQVGDLVRVTSTRNESWIKRIWGGAYPPVRDGKKQAAWGETLSLQMPRTIVAIDGARVTLDTGLPDGLVDQEEADKAGAYLQKLDTSSYVREFGLSHMRLTGRFVGEAVGSSKLLTAIAIEQAEDGYIDDIEATDFGDSTVDLGAWTRRITVQDVRSIRTGEQPGSAKPFDISLRGQQILVQGCASSGNKTFYVATQTDDSAGPNVVQNYRANGAGTFEPHQRWSTGLLLDNIYAPDGGIALVDRGSGGSGQGWGMGYGVVYNSLAGTHNASKRGMDAYPGHTINQPPSAANFGIGLVGPNRSAKKSDAHYDSAGKPVGPASLWAYQLWQRRGGQALGQVIGPWHIRDAASGQCLAVDVASPNAYVVLRDCEIKGQNALWDATSSGLLRLAGTNFCMDADSDRRNTPVKLVACAGDTEQHWSIGARTGVLTQIKLTDSEDDDAGEICLALDGKVATVAACSETTDKTWQVVLTHLAR